MRKTILLDCDGILADFTGLLLRRINAQLGTIFREEDVTEFDISRALRVPKSLVAYNVESRYFCSEIPPFAGARQEVQELRARHNVRIVTAPWPTSHQWIPQRTRWLFEHFGIPPNEITFTASKERVPGDVLIDDSDDTLRSWRDAHPAGLAIRWRRPWNCAQPGVASVSTWDLVHALCEEDACES